MTAPACVAAAACYAAFNVMVSLWRPRGAASFTTTTALFVMAAIQLIPVMAVTDSFDPPGWPWTGVEWSLLGLGQPALMRGFAAGKTMVELTNLALFSGLFRPITPVSLAEMEGR